MDESRKFNRTHRIIDADPKLFTGNNWERGIQKNKQPMVISELQKIRLLNSNLDHQLLEEINNGVTYRSNHYFSPRHFCYHCDVPFLLGDLNHTNHMIYNANIDRYQPYVGYYTGKYASSNKLQPCISRSISSHTKFVEHVKKYMEKNQFITMRFIIMYCTAALGCNNVIVDALLPHVAKRHALTFKKT